MPDLPVVPPAPAPVPPAVSPPTTRGKIVAWLCIGLASLYLLNPDCGAIEFIPDWVPVLGNLDEVGAVLLLLGALDYLGIQLPGFITRLIRRK
jgi:hypothetical protein